MIIVLFCNHSRTLEVRRVNKVLCHYLQGVKNKQKEKQMTIMLIVNEIPSIYKDIIYSTI